MHSTASELMEILNEEATQKFIEDDTLPASMDEFSRQALDQAGVKFRGVTEDPLFRHVELPAGWRKVAARNTSGCTLLIDDRGRLRAQISIKAAPYDRRASCYAMPRFWVRTQWLETREGLICRAEVMDGGIAVVFTKDVPSKRIKSRDIEWRAGDAVVCWLNTNYPNWRAQAAHWDEGGAK